MRHPNTFDLVITTFSPTKPTSRKCIYSGSIDAAPFRIGASPSATAQRINQGHMEWQSFRAMLYGPEACGALHILRFRQLTGYRPAGTA